MERAAKIILTLLLAAAAATHAQAEGKKDPTKFPFMQPELTIDIKDVGRAKAFWEKNPWMKDFRGSALYEGITLRVAPLLNQLGNQETEGWSGKIFDYLFEKVLSIHPLRIQYIHKFGLASPVATTLAGIGETEARILKNIVKLGNRSRGNDAVYSVVKDGKVEKIGVTPMLLKYQRFAVRFHDTCFTIGRDPAAVALASLECPSAKDFKDDLKLRIYAKGIFPSIHPFAKKFLGTGDWLVSSWKLDGEDLVPLNAEIAMEGQSPIGKSGGFETLAAAIPASSWMVFAASLPDPNGMDLNSWKLYFAQSPDKLKSRTSVPWALVHLGAEAVEKQVRIKLPSHAPYSEGAEDEGPNVQELKRKVFVPLTVLLIPTKEDGDKLLMDLSRLFSEKSLYEARYRKVCGGFVAVSNEERAIALIEDACSKKVASLKELPKNIVGAFEKSASVSVLLQPANWLSTAFRQGKRRLLPGASQSLGELQTPESLLMRLPSLHYSGKLEDSKLVLEGTI